MRSLCAGKSRINQKSEAYGLAVPPGWEKHLPSEICPEQSTLNLPTNGGMDTPMKPSFWLTTGTTTSRTGARTTLKYGVIDIPSLQKLREELYDLTTNISLLRQTLRSKNSLRPIYRLPEQQLDDDSSVSTSISGQKKIDFDLT